MVDLVLTVNLFSTYVSISLRTIQSKDKEPLIKRDIEEEGMSFLLYKEIELESYKEP